MSQSTTHSGRQAIAAMFAAAQADERAAFLPYVPIGYPDVATSLDAVAALAEAGADGFEIGVPFSDPLADGPTIQAATQTALQNGVTVRACLDGVRDLRERGVKQPMLLMSYLNPLLAYGVDALVADAAAAGIDGLIIPDLPPEEAALFSAACDEAGLALVFFLAPTSTDERIALVGQQATGFIYVVSITGITGARTALPAQLTAFMARVRQHTDRRLVVGFGISQPAHARAMHDLADGYIVGSALVRAMESGGVAAVRELGASLRV